MNRYSKVSMKTISEEPHNQEEWEMEQRLTDMEHTLVRLDQDLHNLAIMMNDIMRMTKETQSYTIKLASVQDRLNKYISHWPFIRVNYGE